MNHEPSSVSACSGRLECRSADEMILTQDDINLCLGSGELLPCPFCGHEHPISSGERTENGKAIRWKIQCVRSHSKIILMPDCFASVIGVDPDQEKARQAAVKRWNRRPCQNAESSDLRKPSNQTQAEREPQVRCDDWLGDAGPR